MSSEQVSLIAELPFIRRFVFAILQNVRAKKLVHDEKFVIHADLVPKFSERVMQSVMERPVVLPKKPVIPFVIPVKKMIPRKVVPSRPQIVVPVVPPRRMMPQRAPVQKMAPQKVVPIQPQIVLPPVEKNVGLSQDYGKITPLLNDASVSVIECQGAGRTVMVVRAKRRQPTRILLSAGEIKEILEKISDAVHIPILDGVFRAAVDNFYINAVFSEIIGSRFVIRKPSAYSILGE